jgi:hypothetical protein
VKHICTLFIVSLYKKDLAPRTLTSTFRFNVGLPKFKRSGMCLPHLSRM